MHGSERVPASYEACVVGALASARIKGVVVVVRTWSTKKLKHVLVKRGGSATHRLLLCPILVLRTRVTTTVTIGTRASTPAVGLVAPLFTLPGVRATHDTRDGLIFIPS